MQWKYQATIEQSQINYNSNICLKKFKHTTRMRHYQWFEGGGGGGG